MTTEVLEQEQQIETTALTTVERARSITVNTESDNKAASEMIRAIAGLDREAEAFFKPLKQKIDEAKKQILDKEKQVRTPLAEAKTYLSGQIGGYLAREEKKRREEEDKLRKEAQRVAEIAAKHEAEELALQKALAAEQNGDKAEAEAIVSAPVQIAPVFVAPVVIPKTVEKQEGISTRKNWKFRVINEALVPREYLAIDEKKIGGYVRAMKEAAHIPGVEIYSEDSVAVKL